MDPVGMARERADAPHAATRRDAALPAVAVALLCTTALSAAPLPWQEDMIEDTQARVATPPAATHQSPTPALAPPAISNAIARAPLGANMLNSLTLPTDVSEADQSAEPPWIRDLIAEIPPENVRIDFGKGKIVELSPDETLAWATELLAKGGRSKVVALTEAVKQAGGDRARACALEAAVALADRRLADARDAFFRAADARPDPPIYRINGLLVALGIGDTRARASTIAELARHAKREDPAGLAALMALLAAARIDGDPAAIADAAQKILAHPSAGWSTKLQSLDALASSGAQEPLATAIQALLSCTKADPPSTVTS